jgi:acyl phosphate:glycerol-3-phosphate acyltransferase
MPLPADPQAMLAPLAVVAAGGYLLGSLPVGYLVARSHGVDIFAVGSGSSGATNVRRVLGKGPAALVLTLDAAKGAAAAGWPFLLALFYAGALAAAAALPGLPGYVGLAGALVGHSFSCFTRFRGGKGVATAAGGVLVLMPVVALLATVTWTVFFYASRYVSLASIAAAVSLPLLAVAFGHGRLDIAVAALIALFVIIRHRTNVGRLLNGTEKRFERAKGGENA